MGCKLDDHDDDATTDTQPTCKGYELMRDLDFDTDGGGDVDASDTNSYPNWTPIGTSTNKFDAIFEGSLTNGVMPKISNLTISGSSTTEVGLFGATSGTARIKNIGLVDVNVGATASASHAKIGALVGNNAGKVIACYSTGKVSAGAGAYPYAGGLVAFNTGTISASFSHATVYMASGSEPYIGGLTGYNGGTVTAAYAAGAVKGKGSSGFVGGLVGYNEGTIDASYSIAPVTSVASSTAPNSPKPAFLGLGYNDIAEGGTVTASYWDITSGIDDDADRLMPEGKTTGALTGPTSATGIYADWDDLTIDGASDVAPWDFGSTGQRPLLTYGGHTTDQSGNQLFASISSRNPFIGEGTIIRASVGAFRRGQKNGPWQWQSSTDGITWGSTLVSNTVCSVQQDRICGPAYRATENADRLFIVRPELVGKYIRARAPLNTGGYAYTRALKMKPARSSTTSLNPIRGVHSPPRVGAQLSVVDGVAVLWQRCDTNGANPSGCEYVGSNHSYTPAVGDLNHYLRAYIYYESTPGTRAITDFTQQVADVQRPTPWAY